jgi:monoamine oxidase
VDEVGLRGGNDHHGRCNQQKDPGQGRGGAASFFPPGLLTEYRYLFGKAIGRIHFAGTETGSFFWGNMESALESGERTANEVLSG